MLLAIDIGNTNITLGAYEGGELQCVSRLASDRLRTADQYAVELRAILALEHIEPQAESGAIISSVVPELSGVIGQAVKKVLGTKPLTVGPGLKTGLNIRTDIPGQLGADLVVGAVGAIQKYPLPCLIMDLGTATKISVIDESGTYCGCTISPGVEISLNALVQRGSLLPNISLAPPKTAIGTNSQDCMRAGVVFGTADMLDGLADRIQAELNTPVQTIVATGGLARSIVSHCRHTIICDDTLLLDGLKTLYHKNTH